MGIGLGPVAAAAEEPDPPTALWVSDFQNGVYTVAGSPVAVTAMWATDADNWGDFDAVADITAAEGLKAAATDIFPILAGAALAATVPAGATFVFEMNFSNDTGYGFYMDLYQSAGFHGSYLEAGVYPADSSFSGSDTSDEYWPANPPQSVDTKFAMTLAPTHCAVSIDGAAAIASITPDVPNPITLLGFGIDYAPTVPLVIKKITAYAPQADGVLPSLSA